MICLVNVFADTVTQVVLYGEKFILRMNRVFLCSCVEPALAKTGMYAVYEAVT